MLLGQILGQILGQTLAQYECILHISKNLLLCTSLTIMIVRHLLSKLSSGTAMHCSMLPIPTGFRVSMLVNMFPCFLCFPRNGFRRRCRPFVVESSILVCISFEFGSVDVLLHLILLAS